MPRRRKIIAVAAAGVVAAALILAIALPRGRGPVRTATPPDPAHNRYNVILVSVDTLRADRLGCYGYEDRPASPTIDALAEESVLFENDMTAAPWTTPAHLSLLTSLYPSSHGVMASFGEVWRGIKFGVESYYRLPAARVTLAEVLAESGFTTVAFTAGGPVDPTIGFDQGFAAYGTSMFKLKEENVGEMTAWIADHADEQFFLFWHHFEVHAPYLNADFVEDAAPAGAGPAIAAAMREIASAPLRSVWPSGAARLRSQQTKALREHKAYNRDVVEALYTGGVLASDRWLGRLLDALRRAGIYDRTIIVLTSDHGEELGDHDRKLWYNHHGHSMYEEMIHVPLLIKLPGGYAGGTRVAAVVEAVDVMPTILDVLDLVPTRNEMQGESLAPLWAADRAGAAEGIAFTESAVGKVEKKAVRTPRHKYIAKMDRETVAAIGRQRLPDGPLDAELYDLERDPRERRDLLAGDPSDAARAVAADLERRLRAHLAAQRGEAERAPLDPTVIEKLEGLGYIGTGAAERDAGGDAGAHP